mmetsp:Transcript_29431/g.57775  ORF Transcript_29431/g.57775 Transcript_29431/m.57775 type:complete len:137 (-) Transcript_29431:560-970(-)
MSLTARNPPERFLQLSHPVSVKAKVWRRFIKGSARRPMWDSTQRFERRNSARCKSSHNSPTGRCSIYALYTQNHEFRQPPFTFNDCTEQVSPCFSANITIRFHVKHRNADQGSSLNCSCEALQSLIGDAAPSQIEA